MAYETASAATADPVAFKNLVQSNDITTRVVTVISGQNLEAGAVLGKITASGKYNLSLSAAVDGSETPDLILAQDCDASAGDKEAVAIESGTVVSSALTLGAAHTIASIREGLRDKGIMIDD